MKSLFALLFLSVTMVAGAAFAEPYRRLVNFEWEAIEGGENYDIEIKQLKTDGKVFNFKVKEAAWNGRLTPGAYEMKLRALDYRGVPGDWSEPSKFDVQLESAKIVSPEAKSIVKGTDVKESTVEFKWQEVPGAENYAVEVVSDDGTFKKTEITSKTYWKADLPVAKTYTWKVLGQASEEIKSEAITVAPFEVYGSKLDKPKLQKPENDFVREVKWSRPENTDGFDVSVMRKDSKSGKWQKVATIMDHKDDSLSFDPSWTGGDYRVDVRSKGDKRVPSDVATSSFKVRKGDRSPAAEFTHEVRKSIDRVNGWYGIASYLITMINYKSENHDAQFNSATSYSAIGGTGRLGLGYFKEDTNWGFLGIADMSGFTTADGKNPTYMSMEFSGVWRAGSASGDRGEVRVPVGMYYREHQIALGNPSTHAVDSYENAAVLGPQAGIEYWYSISPKLGFQLNAHTYMPILKMKTPNGGALEPTLSTQYGFLGSYRFSKRYTGLMGYARREDTIKFKSTTDGSSNSANLSGDYLNFFAEYAF